MPRRIGCAMRNAMSAAPRVAIPAPATTSAACRPKPVRCGLGVPKLRRQAFETAIIERYRRRESSVEEALIEMYLAGVSVRRVEDITEALWGTRGVALDRVGPQQEDLRDDRGVAQSSDRGRPPVCLFRRHRAQVSLKWRLEQPPHQLSPIAPLNG